MPSSHLAALEKKHARIDQKIEFESQRPLPDSFVLASLKKQKLRLKEEMSAQ